LAIRHHRLHAGDLHRGKSEGARAGDVNALAAQVADARKAERYGDGAKAKDPEPRQTPPRCAPSSKKSLASWRIVTRRMFRST